MSGDGMRAPRRVPGASRWTSRDRVATMWRRRARHLGGSWRARAAEVRHPYGVNSIAPAPGRPGRRERRSEVPRVAAPDPVMVDGERLAETIP